jgi:hypothetical protein
MYKAVPAPIAKSHNFPPFEKKGSGRGVSVPAECKRLHNGLTMLAMLAWCEIGRLHLPSVA